MFTRRTLLLGTAAQLIPLLGRHAQASSVQTIVGRDLYSESAYFDLVSDDGVSGFIARIGRYPSLGRSWLWGHAFDASGVYAFTTELGSSSRQATRLDRSRVHYRSGGDGARFHLFRRGPRFNPRLLGADGSFRAHLLPSPPVRPQHGQGNVEVSFEARLEPGHPPASKLNGRTEVLGVGSCQLTLDGRTHQLRARGHFHEQTQERPRFVNPFVYATLRGPGFYSVAIKIQTGAVGFAWIDGQEFSISAFDIEAPQTATANSRRFQLELENSQSSKTRLEGALAECHLYSVPIFDKWRRGTIVRGKLSSNADSIDLSDRPISGCVNDHLPERLEYSTQGGNR